MTSNYEPTAFPDCINYNNTFYSIPQETSSYTATVTPTNGSAFTPGQQIILDIACSDFIEADSFYFRYKDTTTTAVGAYRIGCPCATPFARLDTLFNNQVKESISQYNQVYNMLVNTTFDVAQKNGIASSFGYVDSGPATGAVTPSFINLDGRILALNETGSYSGLLLGSCLTNGTQLIPACAMGTIRLIFTIDTIANMFNTVIPTAYSMFNFELCYTVIKFPQAYMDKVMNGSKIYYKTMSFNNSAQTVNSGTTGTVSLSYNQHFSSIKSAFIHPSGTSALSLNKNMDSYDITSGNGDYQLTINGLVHPQRTLSTLNNKNGLVMELRRAIGALYNPANSLSINASEFNQISASQTSATLMAKFYVGICLEKLHLNHEVMSGINTGNQNITLTMNINTATSQNHNVNLILLYDMILEIDTSTKQINAII